jgi:eukaryotic-like serine/threonine-protein kinase
MLESGQTLSARFTLVRRLGAGGHGEVWLAEDRERQGYAALKIFAPDLAARPDAIAAIDRNCARVRTLQHSNILKLAGVFRDTGQVFVAGEYAAGGDLSLLRGRPAAEAIPHLIQIAEALEHAHSQGIVHGDLKPTNVLIASDGRALVADFAIVSNDEGAAAGSPYSLSPQRWAGAALTPGDDVYGFGALIYELLSGYPPFYPQPTAERVAREPVPALVPRYPAPSSLVSFAMHCLAKEPDSRPTMGTAIETLRSAAAEIRQGNTATGAAGTAPHVVPPTDDALRPQWQRSVASVSSENPRREGFMRGLAFAALAVLSLAAIGVFVVLPRWSEERAGVAAPQAASAPTPAAAAPASAPIDFARLAEQKQAAETLRASVAERWQELTEHAVERWAAEPAAAVKTALTAGDQAFSVREYLKAQSQFEQAEQRISELERQQPTMLAAKLQEGSQAIEQGDSAKARAAYELAIAISPNHAGAKAGLKRASSLDQVLALLTTARTQEQAGQWVPALGSYRQALQLDPQTQSASAAVSRIESQLATDAFGRAMARGYQHLSASQYAPARAAFEEARKIRPQAPELAQALGEVQQAERTQAIGQHLRRATEAEAQEKWADALNELRAALKLDGTVAAATEGVARVEPRARLHEEFELYLTQPERLFAPAVRQTARVSLDRARALPQQGPVLRSQVEKLEGWLKRAEAPVRVSLQSDNLTRVTIYRVGELGTFSERSLELVPGKYIVLGTRPGFRDVRREFALLPGEQPAPVVIRCEEPV